MKKYTIYKITNKIDGKIYIGKHETADANDNYMGSGKLLKRAQKKYGIENFTKDILHIFDTEDEMNYKESELVNEEFCLREDNYNLCPGGKGGWGYINRDRTDPNSEIEISRVNKIKQTFTKTGIKPPSRDIWTKEHIEKWKLGQNQSWLNGRTPGFSGKTHSEYTKNKMRKPKNVGSSNSQFGTMWITNGKDNKKIKTISSIPEGWHKGRVTK
jgi:hypothetical protein